MEYADLPSKLTLYHLRLRSSGDRRGRGRAFQAGDLAPATRQYGAALGPLAAIIGEILPAELLALLARPQEQRSVRRHNRHAGQELFARGGFFAGYVIQLVALAARHLRNVAHRERQHLA